MPGHPVGNVEKSEGDQEAERVSTLTSTGFSSFSEGTRNNRESCRAPKTQIRCVVT